VRTVTGDADRDAGVRRGISTKSERGRGGDTETTDKWTEDAVAVRLVSLSPSLF
jgi:hypothetical protein